jgi:dolichol-phosphate mannosyltransferase
LKYGEVLLKSKRNVAVILPAYNEEKSIIPLFDKLIRVAGNPFFNLRILVIDDGSTDRTAEMVNCYVRAFPFISLYKHEENRGLGAALKTGIEIILSGTIPADIVITMDCDNTHDPVFIQSLVQKINQGYDIAIASRFVLGGKELGLSRLRKFLSRGASLFLRLFISLKGVTDYSCGYRAYNISILQAGWNKYKEQLITSCGFDCMAELLIKLGKIGAKIAEVPLVLHYERKVEQSKMKIVRTILSYFRLVRLRAIR